MSDVTLEQETALTLTQRNLLAFSYFGQIYGIVVFVLHGVVIFNLYYGAPAAGLGVVGGIMGFYNALNGLPIARLADAGYLNEKCSGCFPIKKCGRRGPWVALGVPQVALASLFLFIPVSKDPGVLIFWFVLIYFLVSNGFTAAFQSTLGTLQETMYTDKMRTRQTLMAVPWNIIAFSLSGLVLPAALFSRTPDTITQCCIQPLASCLENSAPCACYSTTTNGTNVLSFVDEYSKKCPTLKVDVSEHKTRCIDAEATVNGGNFMFWGVLSFLFIMTAVVAIIPASKSVLKNKNEPLYLIPSIKQALKVKSFKWLAWFNFFNALSGQIVNGFLAFFLLYNVGIDYNQVGSTIALVAASGLILSALFNPCWHMLISMRKKGSSLPYFDLRHIGLTASILDGVIGFICFFLSASMKSTAPLIIYSALCAGVLGAQGDQVYHALMGWILDYDEQQNGLRREGMFYACNGAIQHMSIVVYFIMVAILGGVGQDPTVCPQGQNQAVKDVVIIFLLLSRVFKLISAVGYYNYEISGEKLLDLLKEKRKSISLATGNKNEDSVVKPGDVQSVEEK